MVEQTYAEMFREMMANWATVREAVEQAMPDAALEEKYQATAAAFEKSLSLPAGMGAEK